MNEEILHIDFLELTENQAFISWVKYGTDDQKWSSWINSHPDQKSKIDEAKAIVQSFQFEESSLDIDTDRLLSRIDNSIDKATKVVTLDQQTSNVRKLFRRSFIGIAASLAVLVATLFLLRNEVEVVTANGETLVHSLPDNSKVEVNAGSSLEYTSKGWKTDRTLVLEGEAFFDVEKGSKFTVRTANGTVTVLGTEFNVFSRGDDFQVKCTEGKVRVRAKGSEDILMAGDVVDLGPNGLEKIPFKAKFDWRQQAYEYRAESLKEVFSEIERQFDVKINAGEEILSRPFTGPLETRELKKSLYMVTWPMKLDFEVNGNTVDIISK